MTARAYSVAVRVPTFVAAELRAIAAAARATWLETHADVPADAKGGTQRDSLRKDDA